MFPVQNGLIHGDALLPFPLDFALEYAIRKVQVNWKVLRCNGTQKLVVDADGDSLFTRYIHTIKKNTEALLVASKAVDIEVNAEKTKYICTYCEQNAVKNCNIKTAIKSFKNVTLRIFVNDTSKSKLHV